MLEPFGTRLFVADGPTVPFLGIPYPTRMAVAVLADGGLFVWSPIAIDDALAREVDALGPVRHLVAPNKLHHLFLGAWSERYPDAKLHAAPGLARRRRDLEFDAELGDAPDPAWGGEIAPVVVRGSFALEEVVFVHHPSRTALVTDLVQRNDADAFTGWRRLAMRLVGVVGENGSTPLEWRSTFLRRSRAREARARLLALRPEALVVAHGACARSNAVPILERALAWM
ncbi:MAG: DUF4336 domain-containing protein [Myxococcota bacterium]